MRRISVSGSRSARRHAAQQMQGVPEGPYALAAFWLVVESGVTIRRWRSGSNGTAFTKAPDWGVEVPKPTSPVRFAVFAHEVAHQVLHRPPINISRWQEECEAEDWALAAFERFGLPCPPAVRENMLRHVRWTFNKALRRGMAPSAPYALEATRAWAEQVDVHALEAVLAAEGLLP